MIDHHPDRLSAEPSETPVSISHFVHTIRSYGAVILVSLAAIGIGYLIIATVLYLLAPAQRFTTQQFRLDFFGASRGEYPNGTKFKIEDMVSTPILYRVYEQNGLKQYTPFSDFSRSLFVIDSNPAFEKLAADYSSRLSDPKLNPIDRERISREWDAKRESLTKSDYALVYARKGEGTIPDSLLRKTLRDIIGAWANYVVNEQHVLEYRVAVLSPQVVTSNADSPDPIADLIVLRSKAVRVNANIDDLLLIPGADLVRSPKDGMSLEEVKIRLEEMTRFRIDPLIGVARANMSNPAATIRFVETQLAYDQHRLEMLESRAEAVRQALAAYTMNLPGGQATQSTSAMPTKERPVTALSAGGPGEAVTPLVNDTFIDKLMALTSQSKDVDYRQRLADDYQRLRMQVIPGQAQVAFDQETLQVIKSPAPAGGADPAHVREQIAATQADLRDMVLRINEIYEVLSRNLNPAGEIYAVTTPAVTRIERVRSFTRLILYGALLELLSIPVIIIFCLLHNRLREEEKEEGYVAPEVRPAAVS